jgi:hypothetical protein
MIPTGTNVYGIIDSSLSKEEITKKFSAHGWRISKASWFDWEITNDFAELILEGNEQLLIHGPVSPDYFNTLAEKMKEIELSFSLELYDENQNLVTVIKN